MHAATQASATMCGCMCVHCVIFVCIHAPTYMLKYRPHTLLDHISFLFSEPTILIKGMEWGEMAEGRLGAKCRNCGFKIKYYGHIHCSCFQWGTDILKLPTNHPSVRGTTNPVSVCLVQSNTTVGLIKNSWKPHSGVTCQHSPTSPVRPHITCTITQHHMYDNTTSHVRPHNITCTTTQHHMYDHTSHVRQHNFTCMTTQHHMYDNTTSDV